MRWNGSRHFELRATPQMGRSCVFQDETTHPAVPPYGRAMQPGALIVRQIETKNSGQPFRVNERSWLLVALVGVRAERIALGLRHVGGQAVGGVAFDVGQRGRQGGYW